MKQAAELLVRNPVLGVGFGMFMIGQNDLAKEGGADAWRLEGNAQYVPAGGQRERRLGAVPFPRPS
jgi:hypothetical protein